MLGTSRDLFYALTGLKLFAVQPVGDTGTQTHKYLVVTQASEDEIFHRIQEAEDRTGLIIMTEYENGNIYVYL